MRFSFSKQFLQHFSIKPESVSAFSIRWRSQAFGPKWNSKRKFDHSFSKVFTRNWNKKFGLEYGFEQAVNHLNTSPTLKKFRKRFWPAHPTEWFDIWTRRNKSNWRHCSSNWSRVLWRKTRLIRCIQFWLQRFDFHSRQTIFLSNILGGDSYRFHRTNNQI